MNYSQHEERFLASLGMTAFRFFPRSLLPNRQAATLRGLASIHHQNLACYEIIGA
jgi:hypothetical protein